MDQSDLITTTYETLERGVIYDSKKIYNEYFHPLFKEENYYKVLSRMVKNERLLYVAKGLYFSPEYKDGKQLSLKHKHIKKFMLPYRGLGFDVGESLYFRLKLTSSKPLTYTYYVNHIEEKNKNHSKYKVYKDLFWDQWLNYQTYWMSWHLRTFWNDSEHQLRSVQSIYSFVYEYVWWKSHVSHNQSY